MILKLIKFSGLFFLLLTLNYCASSKDAGASCTGDVQYELSVNFRWNASNNHLSAPSGAHFSPPIGSTHKVGSSFWDTGMRASAGIEAMAETGATSKLESEFKSSGNSGIVFKGSLASGPGSNQVARSQKINFCTSKEFPLVTVVSMIAPSPDWFVGTRGLNLLSGGNFVETMSHPMRAYDAGTDSGASFTASDLHDATSLITQINNASLHFTLETATPASPPIGSFDFKKL